MFKSSAIARFVLVGILLATSLAFAQSSGGRFGGSRGFGSGGGSSTYSPSPGTPYGSGSSTNNYGGSHPSSNGGSSPWAGGFPSHENPSDLTGSQSTQPTHTDSTSSGSTSGGGDGMFATIACIGVAAVLIVVALVLFGTRVVRPLVGRVKPDTTYGTTDTPSYCEVRRVSIAFDWSARKELQPALDHTASQFDMSTAGGMWRAACASRDLLANSLPAARYASFQSLATNGETAQTRFDAVCADLNRRYGQATISNARQTPLHTAAFARSEEGQGLVVVSMVIGAMVPLPRLDTWPTLDAVRHALNSLVPKIHADLVALEVVWSPSVDADRLSSAELEVLYPELVRLDEASGVGRVICSHCRCVYALELKRCPSCGSNESTRPPNAPASGVPVSSGTTIACRFCREPMPAYEVQCQGCGGRTDQ